MAGFQKATRKRVFLKLAVTGASGSGKTYSALRLAKGISNKVALIDTENGSASLYADRFDFDTLDIKPPFNDFKKFIDAIELAAKEGYEVIIIDSASHFWEGILEFKDKLDRRGGNSYTNWGEAGQHFKDIIAAVLQSQIHVIACMRSKIDYIIEKNAEGKSIPKKVGLAPIMRDGIEYEFTTVFDIDMSHNAATSKDRTGLFADRIEMITEDTGKRLMEWRNSASAENTPDPAINSDTAEILKKLREKCKASNTGKDAVEKAAAEWGVGLKDMAAQKKDLLEGIFERSFEIESGMEG